MFSKAHVADSHSEHKRRSENTNVGVGFPRRRRRIRNQSQDWTLTHAKCVSRVYESRAWTCVRELLVLTRISERDRQHERMRVLSLIENSSSRRRRVLPITMYTHTQNLNTKTKSLSLPISLTWRFYAHLWSLIYGVGVDGKRFCYASYVLARHIQYHAE